MDYDTSPARIAEIEARAHAMRAEASREHMKAFASGFAQMVAALFGRSTKAA